jgi:hypothetical protein
MIFFVYYYIERLHINLMMIDCMMRQEEHGLEEQSCFSNF